MEYDYYLNREINYLRLLLNHNILPDFDDEVIYNDYITLSNAKTEKEISDYKSKTK
mgnify:CR=1 FL=1